jgi:hypothetical protein
MHSRQMYVDSLICSELRILPYLGVSIQSIVSAQALSEWISLTLKPIRNCIASVLVQWISKWFAQDMNEQYVCH